MITDLKLLIETCRNEMHDREYTGHHADMINKEWISVFQWFSEKGISEFTTSLGYQYCDEIIGSHIIVDGMTAYCGANRPGLRSKTAAFRF